MNINQICVRVAPSPTGDMHIGTLRVALFNWLFARQRKGKFIVRIEDTDQTRYKPESVKSILEGLAWAGLDWDEGPIMKNPKFIRSSDRMPDRMIGQIPNSNMDDLIAEKGEGGPYFQSQRIEEYRKYAEILLEKGVAYRCFCTPQRLEKMRKEQEANKQPSMYDKHCAALSSDEIAKQLASNAPYVIRLKIPEKGTITVNDLIHGDVTFDLRLVDDQVLLKSDQYPTYHLANVVDDHLMGITHVLRGDDWLPSLPKHILLYQGLGWEIPQFGHLPLILAPDRTKLSKRHGAISVLAMRDAGYLPHALLNFTLLLGWNPGKGNEQEIFTKEEMLALFSLEGIQKSPAVFNYEKLNWINKHYIKLMPLEDLASRAIPHLTASGLITPLEKGEWLTLDKRIIRDDYMQSVAALLQTRLVVLKDIGQDLEYLFDRPFYDASLLIGKGEQRDTAIAHLIETKEYFHTMPENMFKAPDFDTTLKAWIKDTQRTNSQILWPLRVALSGKEQSPSPFELMNILGKDETIKRIENAIESLQTLNA
ncbi:MAG: glutamate--tRNA ligase [Patescibacteria group bacterium]